jgi:hypothetical protein
MIVSSRSAGGAARPYQHVGLEDSTDFRIESALWSTPDALDASRFDPDSDPRHPRGERMASRRRGKGRRKVGRKKRRMRSRIRHRKK